MDNSTNNRSEKLLQYLDGELPAIEKDDLEKQIAQDKDLQNELENLKLAKASIRSYGLKQKIAGIHEEMMNEVQAPVRNININKKYPDQPALIQADKEKMVIAFTNIIINAIEAMGTNGTLILTLKESAHHYQVCIKDNGKGISKESLSKLFEPFFTMKKGGMGLGLTVSYSIFQSHHALIKAYSKEHEGTEFHISFKK